MTFCTSCGTKLGTEGFCSNCGAATESGRTAPEAASSPKRCDLCAEFLRGEGEIISPEEMRIISGNGYGKHLPFGQELSVSQRSQKLYQLALMNETDWLVCNRCYDATREYAVDEGGMPHEMFRDQVFKPLMDATQGKAEPGSPFTEFAHLRDDSDSHVRETRPSPKKSGGSSRKKSRRTCPTCHVPLTKRRRCQKCQVTWPATAVATQSASSVSRVDQPSEEQMRIRFRELMRDNYVRISAYPESGRQRALEVLDDEFGIFLPRSVVERANNDKELEHECVTALLRRLCSPQVVRPIPDGKSSDDFESYNSRSKVPHRGYSDQFCATRTLGMQINPVAWSSGIGTRKLRKQLVEALPESSRRNVEITPYRLRDDADTIEMFLRPSSFKLRIKCQEQGKLIAELVQFCYQQSRRDAWQRGAMYGFVLALLVLAGIGAASWFDVFEGGVLPRGVLPSWSRPWMIAVVILFGLHVLGGLLEATRIELLNVCERAKFRRAYEQRERLVKILAKLDFVAAYTVPIE